MQEGTVSIRIWFNLLFLGAASRFQNDCAMGVSREDLIKRHRLSWDMKMSCYLMAIV